MNKQVSVIIPLYNKEKYIYRAINSVLNQSFHDFEVIIVDDGSTDGGADIVKMIPDSRIQYIYQENAGVSAARNKGIQEASNELIAFLDADDEWEPDFLKIIEGLVSKSNSCGLYGTAYRMMSLDGEIKPITINHIVPFEGILEDYFSASFIDLPFNSSSVVVQKSVFKNIGGFSEGKHMGEDIEMWFRIALYYRIMYSSESPVIYHLDAKDRACAQRMQDYPIIETYEKYLNTNILPNIEIQSIHEYIYMLRLWLAKELISNGFHKEAFYQLLKTRSTRLFRHKWWITQIYFYAPRFMLSWFRKLWEGSKKILCYP